MSEANEIFDPVDIAEEPSAPIDENSIEDQAPAEAQASSDSQDTPTDPPRKKRNCGKTGATSIAGRRKSSLNALKHGACSGTHLLNDESEDEWLLVLQQWRESYAPPEARNPCPSGDPQPPALSNCECPACLFDRSTVCAMILKVAEAEWHRRRSQRALNVFLHTTSCASRFNWTPEQHKTYALHLRYKTTDERAFHREFRDLQEYVKTHPTTPPEPKRAEKPSPQPQPEPVTDSETDPEPKMSIVVQDPNSPTGFFCMEEHPAKEGVTYPYPVPRPRNYPSPCASKPPEDPKPTNNSETG